MKGVSRIVPTLASTVLIALGGLTILLAVYFLAVRPPLLPEDLRYIATDAQAISPAMRDWLSVVFHTWGGFIAGYGVMLAGTGLFLRSRRSGWLVGGTVLSLLIAFGRFLYSNIILGSDYLWFIAALFILALAASCLLLAMALGAAAPAPNASDPLGVAVPRRRPNPPNR